MNLLLLEAFEIGALLPARDRRALHISRVLKKGPGDQVLAGLVVEDGFGAAPGSLGKVRIKRLDEGGLLLDYLPESEAPTLLPLRVLLGFPRPIQAFRLLKDLGSLGVAEIVLTGSELGEKSYLESDFWKKSEYRQALLEGAEQAGNPRLPRVRRAWTLERALADKEEAGWREGSRLVLHPGTERPLLGSMGIATPATIAIGSERGWSDRELALFVKAGFAETSLGTRILKTETAALAATVLVLGRMGLM